MLGSLSWTVRSVLWPAMNRSKKSPAYKGPSVKCRIHHERGSRAGASMLRTGKWPSVVSSRPCCLCAPISSLFVRLCQLVRRMLPEMALCSALRGGARNTTGIHTCLVDRGYHTYPGTDLRITTKSGRRSSQSIRRHTAMFLLTWMAACGARRGDTFLPRRSFPRRCSPASCVPHDKRGGRLTPRQVRQLHCIGKTSAEGRSSRYRS